MRTYLILKEKAARFNQDPDIRRCSRPFKPTMDRSAWLSAATAATRRNASRTGLSTAARLAAATLRYEKLDQLTLELLCSGDALIGRY